MSEFTWGPKEASTEAKMYLTPDENGCCIQIPEKEATAIRSDEFANLSDMR